MFDQRDARIINLGESYRLEVQETMKLILRKTASPPAENCINSLKVVELNEYGVKYGMFKYHGELRTKWARVLADRVVYLNPLN